MSQYNKNLKVVTLLEPDLCTDCVFNGAKARVKTEEGEQAQTMVYCTRKDCDNWVTSSAKSITDFEIRPEDNLPPEEL